MKDVVMVGGYQEVDVDFVADNPGLTLFHCHQQLHMDFGFMTFSITFDAPGRARIPEPSGYRKAAMRDRVPVFRIGLDPIEPAA